MAGKKTIERQLRLNGGPSVYPPLPKASKAAQSPSGPTPGIYGTALDNYGTAAQPNWVTGATGLSALARIFLSGQTMQVVIKPKLTNGSQETIFLKRKPFEAKVKGALQADHPVIVSGRFFWQAPRFYDHIRVIRGYYPDVGPRELKWLVNDPFGFKTDGSFSGGRVVYRFDEINSKWMCVFGGEAPARSIVSRPSSKAKPPQEPTVPKTALRSRRA